VKLSIPSILISSTKDDFEPYIEAIPEPGGRAFPTTPWLNLDMTGFASCFSDERK
jgi:hypothetical protein